MDVYTFLAQDKSALGAAIAIMLNRLRMCSLFCYYKSMKNKILSIIILLIAIAGIVTGVLLIPQIGEYGWLMLIASIFMILISIVVYRKGISGAVQSVHDGTPKELR